MYTREEMDKVRATEQADTVRLKAHWFLFAEGADEDSDAAKQRSKRPDGSCGVWSSMDGLRDEFLSLVDEVSQREGLRESPSEAYVRTISAFHAVDEELAKKKETMRAPFTTRDAPLDGHDGASRTRSVRPTRGFLSLKSAWYRLAPPVLLLFWRVKLGLRNRGNRAKIKFPLVSWRRRFHMLLLESLPGVGRNGVWVIRFILRRKSVWARLGKRRITVKKILVLSMVAAATVVYGGFWNTLNRVQKTVETVNAVGDLINGEKKDEAAKPQDAAKAQAEAEAAKRTAPATTAVSNLRTSANQVAAAADPALIASFATARTTATDTAVPEVSYGTVTLKKPATPEQIAEAKNAFLGEKRKLENASIRFEGKTVDDATVAATLAAFHQAGNVGARECAITTLAPFALLRNLQQLSLEKIDCTDMKPLTGLSRLKSVRLHYSKIGDFTPLATLSAMRELDLYGATLSHPFTPLAACSQLESIDYYATKAEPSLYDSLGDLKQVKKFQGGLSKMTSLAWLRRVPNAEDLTIFAEKLEDFDAIGTVTALKRFKGWNMKGDSMSTKLGDLKFLANCKNLEIVELPGSDYTNLEVLTS